MSKLLFPDWKVVRLSDVATIGSGDPAPQGKQYYEGGAHLFVRTQDVGRVKHSRQFQGTKDKVNNKAVKEKGLRLWPKGTTLIPKSGASTLLNNRVRLSEPAYVSSHLATVIPKDNILSLFLYYYLCQLDVRRLLRNPGYPSLGIEDLGSVRILLPSLQEQKMISGSLDSIDEMIEKTENVIAKTEQLRDSLLHKLLTRGFPGHHKEWKEVAGTTPLWRVVKLGDIANVEFSSVDKKVVDGEIPVVLCNYHDVVGNYRIRSGIDFVPATATAKEVDKWTLQQDDVIFTKDAEIGKVSLVEENIPNLVCGYHLGRARPKQDISFGPFLAEALKTPVTQKQITRLQTGLTISGIRLDDMRSIQLLLPPFEEQKYVASVLGGVDEAIEKIKNVIAKTVQLRDVLRHEMLNRGVPGHHEEWIEETVSSMSNI